MNADGTYGLRSREASSAVAKMHAASAHARARAAAVAAANAWEDDLTVRTDSGWVRGSLEEDLRTDRPISAPVRSWRGIPFGADTGGANRFMPAQKVART